ncbi:hypothetical protein JAAARDRAFT_623564 [Jaapia argillacea MUCL 33604]|uniref:Uncharacterized protein n=1 Tax=Jaapia argillacea MUCL 33604 TaxID=933084 RepID=A0A067Q040_9AGAM|nr:hypothetical protein JAAARDRAFT_623564 [Jaapia argillacea MUCL 33604]
MRGTALNFTAGRSLSSIARKYPCLFPAWIPFAVHPIGCSGLHGEVLMSSCRRSSIEQLPRFCFVAYSRPIY